MRIQTKRNSLATALGVVGRAVPTRARQSALPIIGNVLIEATAAGLTLRATDLNMTIEQVLPADVAQYGVTTAPHRLLSEIVGAVDGETVRLSTNATNATDRTDTHADWLIVECGRQTARFSTISADDFPVMPGVPDAAEPLTIGSADLQRLLRLTSLAMAGDTTRPVLHGMLWQLADSHLTLVAADGYRLSVMSALVNWEPADNVVFVLPAETIKAIGSLIGQTEVRIRWGEGRVQLDFGGGIILASQVVAGTFPNYTRLIPKASTVTLTVRRSDLAAAVAVAGVFTGGDGGEKNVCVRLIQDGDDLVVTAERSEVGNSRAALPIVTADRSDGDGDGDGDGDEGTVRVGLNYQYLAELLAAIPVSAEYLTLGWSSPSSPVTVRAIGLDTFVHVSMPMHVQWPPVSVAAAAGTA